MSNPWFRLYAEFAFDPKVQVLTEALQRRYVMSLCLHCDNKLQNRPDDEIALALRITVEDWQTTKQEFIKRGLLSDDGIPTAWDKRQYISDLKDPTATTRQQRYRANKRNNRNATVTSRLPDAETDTDKVTPNGVKLAQKLSALKHPDRLMDFVAYAKEYDIKCDVTQELERFTQYCLCGKGKYTNHIAAFRNWLLNKKDYKNEASRGHVAGTQNKVERANAATRRAIENLGFTPRPSGATENGGNPEPAISEP